MTTQAAETTKAFELIVGQDPQGQVTANVPVRWKISPEMIERLAQNAADPYVLIVVAANGHEMDRYLVPLKAGMTYLQMRRPGINTIHATIVWDHEDSRESVSRIVTKKDDDGMYRCGLLEYNTPGLTELNYQIKGLRESRWLVQGDTEAKADYDRQIEVLSAQRSELLEKDVEFGLRDIFSSFHRTLESERIDVDVPSEMFAKVPPRWMTWMGELYSWPRAPRDQCDLRRRAMFTLPTLPLWALMHAVFYIALGLFWVASKLATVVSAVYLTFLGVRNLEYSAIYDTNSIRIADLWWNKKPSVWVYKKIPGKHGTDKYELRHPVFFVLNPPFVVWVLLVTQSLPWSVMSGLIATLVTVAVLTVLAVVIVKFVTKPKKQSETPHKQPVVTDKHKTKLTHDLQPLTVGGSASLSDLPAQQRTVKLRYQHVKAAVCKPFAR